jgi:hypothetical protein
LVSSIENLVRIVIEFIHRITYSSKTPILLALYTLDASKYFSRNGFSLLKDERSKIYKVISLWFEEIVMATITKQDADHLRATLEDAALRCSERCLYQSAKWYDTYIRNFQNNSSHSNPV